MLDANRLGAFFEALSDKTRAVEAGERHSLGVFFSQYQYRRKIWEEFKRESDLVMASDFNVFSVLNRMHDENAVSAVIAEVLRPSGSHGQQECFMRLFLERLRQEVGESSPSHGFFGEALSLNKFEKFVVETEHVTNTGRRIDLWIATSTRFIIAIENKIFAQDQPKQLEDYLTYLEALECNFILIYLTLDKKYPSESSLPKSVADDVLGKKLIRLSYADFIIPWLEICVEKCQSIRVRFFLKDMLNSLHQSCQNGETPNGYCSFSG